MKTTRVWRKVIIGFFNKTDFKTKFFDGPISAMLIVLFAGLMIGLIHALEAVGQTGVLVGLVGKLAAVGFFIKTSFNPRLSGIWKAWLGIISGMITWTVLELAEVIGLTGIDGLGAIHLFGLALISTLLFWKSLPTGGRFFVFIILLNWGGHLAIEVQKFIASLWEIFEVSFTVYGWTMVPLTVFTIYWTFEKTETRVERLYFAGWLYLFLFTVVHLIFIH